VSAFEHLVQVLLLFASFAQVGVPHAGKLCPLAQGSVVPSSQDDSINDTTKPPIIANIKMANPSLSVFFILTSL
jgi:hypothetical protein